jgi:hypothetical protein
MLARPMARSALLPVALFAAAALGVAWAAGWFGDGGHAPAPDAGPGAGDAAATAPTPASGGAAAGSGGRAPAPAAGAPTAAAAQAPPDPLADRPTACLRAIDRDAGGPLAGVAVHRCKDSSAIAFTDDRGLAPVPLVGPEQLALPAPGYLTRMVPTRLGSSEREPQDVPMVRDVWSIARTLALRTADGRPVAEARVRIQPVAARRHIPNPVPNADAAGQRAWIENSNVARIGVPSEFVPAAGAIAPVTVRTCADGGTLRFEAEGEYAIVAATADGRLARATYRATATPRTGGPDVALAFAPGAALRGRVVDPAGRPIAGATVTATTEQPDPPTATSGEDGAFVLAPLFAGEPAPLHVRHGLHQPAVVESLRAPADDVVVTLTPLPQSPLRGRVRTRPGLQPLAQAAVVWQPEGADPVAATTGADGEFLLQATGKQPARLTVTAIGHLAYTELVNPGAPFADYDLWPGTADARVTAGVSALLEGVAVDAAGAPVADVDVQWTPAQPPAAALPTGRRVLAGGAVLLPRSVRTGPDGSFRLETNAFGPGRLHVAGAPERGVDATAVAGAATNGLRIPR